MRKLPEIDALCVSTRCEYCGESYIPTRATASAKLKRSYVTKNYCSPTCRYQAGKDKTIEAHNRVMREKMSGVAYPDDHPRAKIEQNMFAKFMCVRSPDGVEYKFRNVNNFVRTHPHLFPPGYTNEPLQFPGTNRIATLSSRAAMGLRQLFFRGKAQRESWRGWVGIWKKDRLGNVEWERGS